MSDALTWKICLVNSANVNMETLRSALKGKPINIVFSHAIDTIQIVDTYLPAKKKEVVNNE